MTVRRSFLKGMLAGPAVAKQAVKSLGSVRPASSGTPIGGTNFVTRWVAREIGPESWYESAVKRQLDEQKTRRDERVDLRHLQADTMVSWSESYKAIKRIRINRKQRVYWKSFNEMENRLRDQFLESIGFSMNQREGDQS